MMLQNGFVMGRITDSRDHFHDLRLDVDTMSYEVCFSKYHEKKLTISFLNFIEFVCFYLHSNFLSLVIELVMWILDLKKARYIVVLGKSNPYHILLLIENAASVRYKLQIDSMASHSLSQVITSGIMSFILIFFIVWWLQDEYETEDEVGKLNCGHSFHVHCVKQWLSRKNACPVCKKTAYVKS